MDISSTESRMERVLPTHMIVLAGSMRVYGDNLERMILLQFAYWVWLSSILEDQVLIITSNSWSHE